LEFIPSFSDGGYGNGWWVLVMVQRRVEHNDSIIYRRFGIDEFFFASFICVDARLFCVLSWVVCGLHVNGDAESETYKMAAVRRRLGALTGGLRCVLPVLLSLQSIFDAAVDGGVGVGVASVRYVSYSSLEKSGWSSSPTSGGSSSLLGSSSFGGLELQAFFGRQVLHGLTMRWPLTIFNSRIVQRLQSMSDDVLLKKASSNFVSSPGRRPASGCEFRNSVARSTGSCLQGLDYNFFFFQGCLCNLYCNHQKYQ
jgi:hypothetical protein